MMGLGLPCCKIDPGCDLCALDVFSGGDPTAETISVGVGNFASVFPCTPAGGSGAGALLGSAATPIIHVVPFAAFLGNGCPLYTLIIPGTGASETGQVTVIIGPATTLCGTTDCAIILTYNPAAQLQRIYEFTGGAWSSCSVTNNCGADGTVGDLIGTPFVTL